MWNPRGKRIYGDNAMRKKWNKYRGETREKLEFTGVSFCPNNRHTFLRIIHDAGASRHGREVTPLRGIETSASEQLISTLTRVRAIGSTSADATATLRARSLGRADLAQCEVHFRKNWSYRSENSRISVKHHTDHSVPIAPLALSDETRRSIRVSWLVCSDTSLGDFFSWSSPLEIQQRTERVPPERYTSTSVALTRRSREANEYPPPERKRGWRQRAG